MMIAAIIRKNESALWAKVSAVWLSSSLASRIRTRSSRESIFPAKQISRPDQRSCSLFRFVFETHPLAKISFQNFLRARQIAYHLIHLSSQWGIHLQILIFPKCASITWFWRRQLLVAARSNTLKKVFAVLSLCSGKRTVPLWTRLTEMRSPGEPLCCCLFSLEFMSFARPWPWPWLWMLYKPETFSSETHVRYPWTSIFGKTASWMPCSEAEFSLATFVPHAILTSPKSLPWRTWPPFNAAQGKILCTMQIWHPRKQ